MTIYSGFSHWKLWFSIVMLVYQRLSYTALNLNWCKHPNNTQIMMHALWTAATCRVCFTWKAWWFHANVSEWTNVSQPNFIMSWDHPLKSLNISQRKYTVSQELKIDLSIYIYISIYKLTTKKFREQDAVGVHLFIYLFIFPNCNHIKG